MKKNLSHESQTLTAKEAAALLPGMTYARLMRLAKQGEIPSIQYRVGARRFFRVVDIAEYARASGVELSDPIGQAQDIPIPGLGRAGR